jgi:hypothetical protein
MVGTAKRFGSRCNGLCSVLVLDAFAEPVSAQRVRQLAVACVRNNRDGGCGALREKDAVWAFSSQHAVHLATMSYDDTGEQ